MWTGDGWRPADHLSIRETVRCGLREIKAFWEARGSSETEPQQTSQQPTPDAVNGFELANRSLSDTMIFKSRLS